MIMNAIRAEWARLMSRNMFLGGIVLVALGALTTLIVFTQAGTGTPGTPDPGGISLSTLGGPKGIVQSLQFTGTLMGAISLVLFARTVTTEYQNGTLKVKLAREPRRLVLLSAKFLAMALFVAASLVAAFVAIVAVASIVGGVRGIDTSQWWTGDGIVESLLGLLRLLLASLVWGLFGFALGTILRSGGAAIGIGLGGLLIGGHIGERFWADAGRWLPDQVLAIFTIGGTDAVSMAYASLIVAVYAIVLSSASAFGFARGDVPG